MRCRTSTELRRRNPLPWRRSPVTPPQDALELVRVQQLAEDHPADVAAGPPGAAVLGMEGHDLVGAPEQRTGIDGVRLAANLSSRLLPAPSLRNDSRSCGLDATPGRPQAGGPGRTARAWRRVEAVAAHVCL